MAELDLTPEQEAAIQATGHTLLVANAGTGKTTTIVRKVLWLLGHDIGVPRCDRPCRLDEIAAITFTEKAAYDLKRKLREEIGKMPQGEALVWQLERAALGTIHSFCGQLLRENALRLGIDPGFTVLDEQDARVQQDQMLRELILERLQAEDEDVAELVRTFRMYAQGEWGKGSVDLARDAFRDLRWHRERYNTWISRNELDTQRIHALFGGAADAPDQLVHSRCAGLHRIVRLALERWREHEVSENVRDFDSLILDARALLTGPNAAAALAGIRRRYRILIIDEFQDTDGAQRDIAYAIARHVDRPQLFLVGDPKQSIYRFRGADITVWNDVQEDLAKISPVLPLSQNFRSDPAIIEFVNVAAAAAINTTGTAVEANGETRVAYSPLRPGRSSLGTGLVEWRVADDKVAGDRRTVEGQHLVEAIRSMVGQQQIVDADTGDPRAIKFSDIAVLYRTRTGLVPYQDELTRAEMPYHEHSPAGLAERQEIMDLLNLLRLVHNPHDDLRAFAYLRSPFAGLRDEVLSRIRLEHRGGSYRWQAGQFLSSGDWFAAPEHARIADVERYALERALAAYERASHLADRIPLDELLEQILQDTGYREHLALLEGSVETLANIRAFLRVVEQFRDHSIGSFLQYWDDRDDRNEGVPQAQIYSRTNDVITFSTIHAAKGLEWPVVFLVDVSAPYRDKSWNDYWTDPALGPILCPATKDRGARAQHMAERNDAQVKAEEARLLYVAATRARDRLIVLGNPDTLNCCGMYLSIATRACDVPVIDQAPAVEATEPRPQIDLQWLDAVEQGGASPSSVPLPRPPQRWMTSATGLMTHANNPADWTRKYVHGYEAQWTFAPKPSKKRGVPERIRGDIIHGVLERITEQLELVRVLEETIGELDAPELEFALAPGTQYRAALEAEIARVVSGEEWAWYVAGEHARELPFLHLAGPRDWRIGAFDLYRSDGWIIDFKTHQISADRAEKTAEGYRLQMQIYREAAAASGAQVRTKLHFTHPGVVVELE